MEFKLKCLDRCSWQDIKGGVQNKRWGSWCWFRIFTIEWFMVQARHLQCHFSI